MCTVSVIHDPIEQAIRLVCNRDELRSRQDALPPRITRFRSRRAIMPIDPLSGGTWIAVNDAALVMTLLNYHPRAASDDPKQTVDGESSQPISRGRIIPSLLHHEKLEDAIDSASRIQLREYQPFRLVMLDLECCCELSSDGRERRLHRWRLSGEPMLFTSSGLGDELVQCPRRELFEQMVPHSFATAAAQDAFHGHSWAGREHISVLMSRAEACTVARTTIELSPRAARMTYEPVAKAGGFAPPRITAFQAVPARVGNP